MKNIKYIIIVMFLLIFNIVSASIEYFQKDGKNFVKMKGLLKVEWESEKEEEDHCGKLYGMEFKPEVKEAFAERELILYITDIDYYTDLTEAHFEKENME